MSKRKRRLVNLSTIAKELGVKPQSVTRQVRLGRVEIVEIRGKEKLVDRARAKKAIKEAAIRSRDGAAPPTKLMAATIAKLKSELSWKTERLERFRARYTYADAAAESGRMMTRVLLPLLAPHDALVANILAAGDGARVRAVLSTWARDTLQAAAGHLETRAADLCSTAAPAPDGDGTPPNTIVELHARITEIEAGQQNLRLAALRGEVTDRKQSRAASEELGRRVRARVEQIANMSTELADAARVGQEVMRARLGAAISAIAADLEAMLDQRTAKGEEAA